MQKENKDGTMSGTEHYWPVFFIHILPISKHALAPLSRRIRTTAKSATLAAHIRGVHPN